MADWKAALFDLAVHIVTFGVMIVLAIVAFFITTFVVVTGASLAGVQAQGNFVVLSSAILVAAAIIGGRSAGTSMPSMEEEEMDETAGPEIA